MADISLLKDNLTRLGYDVSVFDTAKEAADYLCGKISAKSVGFGGSVTLRQMDMYARLSACNDVYWHWVKRDNMSGAEIIAHEQTSQIYLCSVNGIAESGEIVNIDGSCNRISAMVYGHEMVYFVIGENKICPDLDSAVYRARNIAAPKNAQRLSCKTPCAAKADKCYNCKSPDRICRGVSVLLEKPSAQKIEVVIIREELGY